VAAAVPNRTAVDDGERQLTYAELLRATRAIARAVDAHEPMEGAEVAVIVDRGIDGIVTVLGVMTAGRVAVPLDAHDPVERLAFVAREAQVSLVLTHRSTAPLAEAIAGGAPVLALDDVVHETAGNDDLPDVDPAKLALVLFTSGSTGTPKGVVRDHDTLVRHGLVVTYANGIGPEDRVAITGAFGFVGAYVRSLGAFFGGGTACPAQFRSVGLRDFATWVTAQRITILQLVPSVLRALVDAAPDARMDTVKLITLGGETLYSQDVRRARARFGPHTVFQHRLGATEGASPAVWDVTAADDANNGPLPIGRIEPWVEIRIVGDDGADVREGEPGTLEVVSDHQALGYWRDPQLSAACFFDLPDGRRGFRTSDIVRRRPDGVLEHLGRADDRVKVRGAMVSPSEVERALTSVDGVERAAVAPVAAPDGGTRLAAYIVPDPGATPSPWQIRRDLATRVPSTMIPSAVVVVDDLPTTPRGKVDHAALPPPPPPTARPYREPEGRERELAELFGEVLGLDDVGLDDDFFELGGDSLAVLELLAGINERFDIELSATAVLAAPTVAALATRLVRRRRTAATVLALRESVPADGPVPLFCVAGGGSPAVSLRPLADALGGDRTCYGVQARGLEETARPDRSIQAAAHRHLAEIGAIQPTGPYLLAGYSYGGLVAFELACALEARGERVALLAILDTPAPSTMLTRGERLAAGAPPRHEGVFRKLNWAARAAQLHTRERLTLATAGIVPRRSLYQYHLFFRYARRMAREYRPTSRLVAPILVVRVADSPYESDLGWSAFSHGPVTTIEAPGNHDSMVRRPYVTTLGAELRRAFAAAEHGGDTDYGRFDKSKTGGGSIFLDGTTTR
jgi:amino acid adenylation domain-containing protein